jgi:DNA-directed RNA polymerase alpha subunit
MSVRGYNCLKRAGLNTVQDVLDYVEKHGNLQKIRNMGPSCECNIQKAMKDVYGLDMYTGEVTDGTDT